MIIKNFNQTIDIWIKALVEYDLTQLRKKPLPNSWSLGQVYMHLIDDTNYYIEQMKLCVSANENEWEQASPDARVMFANNGLPEKRIEGSPANAAVPQPISKEQLNNSLMFIKDEIGKIEKQVSNGVNRGKTKHPGLGYFNAMEWLQFTDTHFRHHLMQKKRIDEFLQSSR